MHDPTVLSPDERLIYLIKEVENYSMMEGWYGFFRSPTVMPYYEELKRGLERINADSSLSVLLDFERAVESLGFTVTNEGIDDLISSDEMDDFDETRDYSKDWFAHSEELWETVGKNLHIRGYRLQSPPYIRD